MVCKHDRYTRLVVTKEICSVDIKMRKHEVESIACTSANFIVFNARSIYKFKVNAITIMPNHILGNVHVVTFPAMYCISHDCILHYIARNIVVNYRAMSTVLEHNTELICSEHTMTDNDGSCIFDVQATVINA